MLEPVLRRLKEWLFLPPPPRQPVGTDEKSNEVDRRKLSRYPGVVEIIRCKSPTLETSIVKVVTVEIAEVIVMLEKRREGCG